MAEMQDTRSLKPDIEPRPNGLIVVDKPPGPTTYDCIRHLRRACRIPRDWKMGHLGTLDPFATGVVVIAMGQAVRYAEYALHSTKKYRARLWLGEETDTLDPTGKVIDAKPVPPGLKARLPDAAAKFTGFIEQMPPAFSAKQVGGRRSYKAARKGEKVELRPVKVEILSIAFDEPAENWVDFVTVVSAGTYIRALGRDIARELGTVGHLIGLERLAVGRFPLEEAIPFDAFEVGGARPLLNHLRPVEQILEHLAAVTIRSGAGEKVLHGRLLSDEDFEGELPSAESQAQAVRLVDTNGKLMALGRPCDNPPGIVPFKPWVAD